jgi:acyl-CoA synthetase (NDP forming)/RimJ/RimL family protein N-acetyltransferase
MTDQDGRRPGRWEADVVLADGGTAHVRPIEPEDADRLKALHGRLSPESIRYRYFAPRPTLSPGEVERLTHVDHNDREALVAVLGDDLLAVARYERLPGTDIAEVAFVVDDAHQGRGLASVLLEHLAALAAGRGIQRFEADVLPDNLRMARVFLEAGYQAHRSYEEDAVHFVFPIEATATSLAVMHSREHNAEARSIRRLLTPGSVAVIGAGRTPDSIGHAALANLLAAEFQGPVYPVNRTAHHVGSVRAYPTVSDVPDDIDLAVIAVPAAAVRDIIAQCTLKGVRGLVVLSAGFSDAGSAGLAAERELVTTARANGMRVIGPNCLGVINTDAQVRLNATLAPALPRRGRAGIFSQSWAIGVAILDAMDRRGLGLSTFVSAGNRADVSGNDLLQYWEDDPDTDIALLYLESFGNARKFCRLARRIGRRKPIIAVKSGGAVAARLPTAVEPERVVDALFRQAGVIRVDTLSQLLDVTEVLTWQPLPGGRRVAVVGNSRALTGLTADSCVGNDLTVARLSPATEMALRSALGPNTTVDNPLVLTRESSPADLVTAVEAVLADPAIDAVVTAIVPPQGASRTQMCEALATASTGSAKPLVTSLVGFSGLPGATDDRPGDTPTAATVVPSFPSPEVAAVALGRAAAYGEWRRQPEGAVPAFPDIDEDAARALVTEALKADGAQLGAEQADELLARYGVRVWPLWLVASEDEAVAAAAELGYPVVLKATAEEFRHRLELGTVRLDIATEEELRAAYRARAKRLGQAAGLAVQKMATPGVTTVVRAAEDPSFGALISFGIGGVATDLLGDRAFRVLPLTDRDAAELVRSVRAAPLLFGYRGGRLVDMAALEELLLRIGRLADDLPEVAELELNPVIAAPDGVSVLGAAVRVAVPSARLDVGPRRMR